jgi:hypothetical protein
MNSVSGIAMETEFAALTGKLLSIAIGNLLFEIRDLTKPQLVPSEVPL